MNGFLGFIILGAIAVFYNKEIFVWVNSIPKTEMRTTFVVIGIVILLFVIEMSKKPAKKD